MEWGYFFFMSAINISEEEKIIYDLIHNKYDDCISRYILEGILLYEYKYTPKKVYNIIMNLTLANQLELILKSDGEYYQLNHGEIMG